MTTRANERGIKLWRMNKWPHDSPESLRERAERAFRLASATTDQSAHDALMLYGQELLAEADRIEGAPEQPEDGRKPD